MLYLSSPHTISYYSGFMEKINALREIYTLTISNTVYTQSYTASHFSRFFNNIATYMRFLVLRKIPTGVKSKIKNQKEILKQVGRCTRIPLCQKGVPVGREIFKSKVNLQKSLCPSDIPGVKSKIKNQKSKRGTETNRKMYTYPPSPKGVPVGREI